MTRLLPSLTALSILWGSGLVHGRWSDRSRDARALREAVARLDRVPLELGDWSGSELAIDRRGLDRMGVSGVIARRYEDRRRGEAVTAMIVCGPPGPISAHGPEACYAGIGYESVAPPARVAVSSGDNFWMADFRKGDRVLTQDLRIFWAWGTRGRWHAAGGPRLDFAGEPSLYKLYILRETDRGDGRMHNDPCLEFARALLPELETALFPRPRPPPDRAPRGPRRPPQRSHRMFDATVMEPGNPPETGKRLVDAVLSAALIMILGPVWLAAMALVKLTSRGPAMYTQERLGWHGRRFTILKIRTMFHDCERLTGPLWSTGHDPRVTRIGRFLRRTHLDELPQLWNVLRGDMSLVGPRPERPEIASRLELAMPRYADRLQARPGLTGLAQVQLPPDSDLESVRLKLDLDLLYIERQSLGFDLRILACTGFFLLGIPFPVSCRLFRLDGAPDQSQPSGPARDSADRVHHAQGRPVQGVEC